MKDFVINCAKYGREAMEVQKIDIINFWLMYVQVGNFLVSNGPPTVQLTQILRNAVFFKTPVFVETQYSDWKTQLDRQTTPLLSCLIFKTYLSKFLILYWKLHNLNYRNPC